MHTTDFRCRQQGQSLIEGLVGLLALVPLLFSAMWLARVIDLQQAVVSAAREAAFECTVGPSGCPAGPVPDPLSLQAFSRESAVLWHDGRGQSALADPSLRAARWEALRFNTPFAFAGGSASQTVPGAVHLLSNLAGPGRFGLPIDAGLSRAHVAVPLPGSPLERFSTHRSGLLGGLGALRLEAQLAILSDDWMARAPEGSAPDTVRSRVEAGQRVPGIEEALRAGWWPIRGVLQLAAWVGLESSAEGFNPYFIDVDQVPPDRLGLSPWPIPPTPTPDPLPADPGTGAWIQDGA